MQVLNGKEACDKIKSVAKLSSDIILQRGVTPHLVVIQVGDDAASNTYITNKSKVCSQVGVKADVIHYGVEVTQDELVAEIRKLNKDASVNGILVQLPLPKHINKTAIMDAIDPRKDVDCFNVFNVGRLMQGRICMEPCTPAGIMQLLKYYGIGIAGKHCVIVGRSDIVGKPLAMMMTNADATVTLCHSHTENLKEICNQADILVCAIGSAKFFDSSYVKDGSVVIDVGINRDENGKLCGDVDFDSVKEKASAISPVPGGVGVMTTTMLANNVIVAALLQTVK